MRIAPRGELIMMTLRVEIRFTSSSVIRQLLWGSSFLSLERVLGHLYTLHLLPSFFLWNFLFLCRNVGWRAGHAAGVGGMRAGDDPGMKFEKGDGRRTSVGSLGLPSPIGTSSGSDCYFWSGAGEDV